MFHLLIMMMRTKTSVVMIAIDAIDGVDDDRLQELQRIVKDLFHLINEKNADLASQEVLAESGWCTIL